MSKKNSKSVNRIASFKYALSGLKIVFRNERNLQVHFLSAILVVIIGMLLKISNTEWAVVSVVIAMVVSAEIFNTAIEFIVDFISPSHHKTAGKIKDISAAGVLVCSIGAIFAGSFVFLPKVVGLLAECFKGVTF